ncbi:hypothetical protein B5807_04819 [Epicoccum nigrum]|jgi:U4/U6.U5 tri-snRNP-associated protein 1|uniref:SART-1 protein n=1 Tax=Epicoccum nigrum TaxID=105696 RepID=A0A1Y2M2N7_EPING|nr:hypothetical protein B5807_04819 [Epicoccum nigrum]
MADLSIDEVNKIRLAMGMPALPGGSASAAQEGLAFKPAKESNDSDDEPASTIDIRQAAAHDNWLKLNAEQEAKRKREERAAAIKKERERAARTAKLDGKGLAEEAPDDDDMAWLKGSKKRQKKIMKAEQMQRDLEERERQAREAMQYTETDLAGVKVGHEVDQFDDEDQILVLKDTAVDADDDDELEAVALKERERLQERLDSKKRKRTYDPNDEDGQKSILAQYDEEIEGKKGKAFTLDGKGRTVEDVQAAATSAAQPKRVAISLDILQDDAPANDYLDLSEIKMKKPKKKKTKKAKRERIEDDEEMVLPPTEEPNEDMELDSAEPTAPKPKKKSVFDESFIDDDDLQANLAAQRRKALKKRNKMRPEDIARQLREEDSAPQTPDVITTTEDDEGKGLVIDETTEFVHNLGAIAGDAEEETRRRRRKSSHISEGIKTESPLDEDGDIDMNQSYGEVAEAEDARERSASRAQSFDDLDTGLGTEKTVDGGMGATLALLRQRGLVAAETDASTKNALYRDRQKFLADKQRAEGDAERQRKIARERERNSSRWNTMTPREREEYARKQNNNADVSESRRLAEIFNKEYKPNVELNYVDEHGRQMNQKEAFKQLSHQFHGKGSGNTKTKKYLDKVAQEKKKMAESSLEVTRAGGVGSAHDQQAKKLKTAGVRLQ